MNPFKVGDIITGLPNKDYYGITTDAGTFRVLSANAEYLVIECLTHQRSEHAIGKKFNVEARYFQLVEIGELRGLAYQVKLQETLNNA
jgi:hypothetical protein